MSGRQRRAVVNQFAVLVGAKAAVGKANRLIFCRIHIKIVWRITN